MLLYWFTDQYNNKWKGVVEKDVDRKGPILCPMILCNLDSRSYMIQGAKGHGYGLCVSDCLRVCVYFILMVWLSVNNWLISKNTGNFQTLYCNTNSLFYLFLMQNEEVKSAKKFKKKLIYVKFNFTRSHFISMFSCYSLALADTDLKKQIWTLFWPNSMTSCLANWWVFADRFQK